MVDKKLKKFLMICKEAEKNKITIQNISNERYMKFQMLKVTKVS